MIWINNQKQEEFFDMCIAGGKITTLQDGEVVAWAPARDPQLKANRVAAHQHLYFEGDPRTHIYFIEKGWVKVYRTLIDGQRQIVGFANAGSVLGLESDDDHCNTCETVTEVVVRAVPVSRLQDQFLRDPILADQLLRQIGRQLGAAQAQLAAVGTQSAEQKLATFLLTMQGLSGAEASEEFDLPMRRGDMAEFLGLRLETISRKMSDFQRKGWIKMTSLYRCRIVARHVLEELAEGGNPCEMEILAS